MFRKLQRYKNELSFSECVEILNFEKRGVLSVIGDEGYPYGMPMNHYYNFDDGCIYFHCVKVGHRLDSLKKCDKVSFCVLNQGTKNEDGWSYDFKSVVIFGKIEIVDDDKIVSDITRKLSRKFTTDEEYIDKEICDYIENTILLKLTCEHLCGKLVHEA